MSKKPTQQLIDNCRARWREFDPISLVIHGADVSDEYESYVPYTAELVANGADKFKLTAHIETACT